MRSLLLSCLRSGLQSMTASSTRWMSTARSCGRMACCSKSLSASCSPPRLPCTATMAAVVAARSMLCSLARSCSVPSVSRQCSSPAEDKHCIPQHLRLGGPVPGEVLAPLLLCQSSE